MLSVFFAFPVCGLGGCFCSMLRVSHWWKEAIGGQSSLNGHMLLDLCSWVITSGWLHRKGADPYRRHERNCSVCWTAATTVKLLDLDDISHHLAANLPFEPLLT